MSLVNPGSTLADVVDILGSGSANSAANIRQHIQVFESNAAKGVFGDKGRECLWSMTNIVLPLKHHAGLANGAADVEELSGVAVDDNVHGKVPAAACGVHFDIVDSADLGFHLVERGEWNAFLWRATTGGKLESCKC